MRGITSVGLLLLMLASCTSGMAYRSNPIPCEMDSPSPPAENAGCGQSEMERHRWTTETAPRTPDMADVASYSLSFVEFDDQGKPYDPGQQRRMFDRLAAEALTQDLSIVVFVHGWKHNARADDDNVQDFHQLLKSIAEFEAQKPPAERRRVFGIYAGWRGLSGTVDPIYNLSFWGRKDTAQRVAEGALRGLLGELRAFRDTIALKPSLSGSGGMRETRLLTIGHSFGGLIVWSALSQYFIDRAAISLVHARYFPEAGAVDHASEKLPDARLISSYGDLVVIINPAVEAMRYEPLRELVQEQSSVANPSARYARCQPPVLVEVTSTGDSATGVAFPLGRKVNTLFEQTWIDAKGEDERAEIESALGHYKPFLTHELDAPSRTLPQTERSPLIAAVKSEDDRTFAQFEQEFRHGGLLSAGWHRTFRSGATLTHKSNSLYDANNPFWVVEAHPNVILDHNDIAEPVFVGFVGQLYDDLDRLRHAPECR